MNKDPGSRRAKEAAALALFTASVHLMTFFLCLAALSVFGNNLYLNGNWGHLLEKRPDSYCFHNLPHMLNRGRLNMNANRAVTEAEYKDKVRLSRACFSFRLPRRPDPYFYFVFGKGPQGFSALRIGGSAAFGDGYGLFLRADPGGGFTEDIPLGLPQFNDGKWHEAEIDFLPDQGILQIDGKKRASFPGPPDKAMRLGFVGALAPAAVDKVRIYDRSRGLVLRESFSDIRFRPFAKLAVFLLYSALCSTVFFIIPGGNTGRRKMYILWLFYMSCSVLCLSAMTAFPVAVEKSDPAAVERSLRLLRGLFQIDRLTVSSHRHGSIYTEKAPEICKETDDIEKAVYDKIGRSHGPCLNTNDAAGRIAEIFSGYYPRKDRAATRVMFLGTSQTFGEGAPSAARSFVSLLESRLNA